MGANAQKATIQVKRCPSCGATEDSGDWRFVAAPGGGLWACDCGAMWRDWDHMRVRSAEEIRAEFEAEPRCDKCGWGMRRQADGWECRHCGRIQKNDGSVPDRGLCELDDEDEDDEAEQSGPFETITDEHDGQTDLRAVITLPIGFKVEVAIEDATGEEPRIVLYAGTPCDSIPETLLGTWNIFGDQLV